MRRLFLVLALVAQFCALSQAGEIPKGFRGIFTATEAGLKVELKEDKAIFEENGRAEKLSVFRETGAILFAKLAKGKSGVYIEDSGKATPVLSAFAVICRDTPVKESAGLSWRNARVYYFTMPREQQLLAQSLEISYSDDGLVTLDTLNAAWQIGWGAKVARFRATRAEPK
jgi:hypothetical protein